MLTLISAERMASYCTRISSSAGLEGKRLAELFVIVETHCHNLAEISAAAYPLDGG